MTPVVQIKIGMVGELISNRKAWCQSWISGAVQDYGSGKPSKRKNIMHQKIVVGGGDLGDAYFWGDWFVMAGDIAILERCWCTSGHPI